MRVAAFAMPDRNHLQDVLSVGRALGATVRLYSHASFADDATGLEFEDVFTRWPLDAADDASRPLPCRNVTWAATFGDQLAETMAEFGPDLVLYDSFAVAGQLAAERLGIPAVAARANHAIHTASELPALKSDPRVSVSDACRAAVATLQSSYGWADATPFSYYDVRADLNVVREPPLFLDADERAALEPCAFWGPAALTEVPARAPVAAPLRVYASVGTIVWRYWPGEALALLAAVAEAAGEYEAVLSLGGSGVDGSALQWPKVTVAPWLDQQAALARADAMVTHAGAHSVHEALVHGVPLLTAPFFADQPLLAARCAELGVAVPLGDPLTGVGPGEVTTALRSLFADPDALHAALTRAQEAERDVIAARPEVVARIRALVGL